MPLLLLLLLPLLLLLLLITITTTTTTETTLLSVGIRHASDCASQFRGSFGVAAAETKRTPPPLGVMGVAV